jgi:hypothetical protein
MISNALIVKMFDYIIFLLRTFVKKKRKGPVWRTKKPSPRETQGMAAGQSYMLGFF